MFQFLRHAFLQVTILGMMLIQGCGTGSPHLVGFEVETPSFELGVANVGNGVPIGCKELLVTKHQIDLSQGRIQLGDRNTLYRVKQSDSESDTCVVELADACFSNIPEVDPCWPPAVGTLIHVRSMYHGQEVLSTGRVVDYRPSVPSSPKMIWADVEFFRYQDRNGTSGSPVYHIVAGKPLLLGIVTMQWGNGDRMLITIAR